MLDAFTLSRKCAIVKHGRMFACDVLCLFFVCMYGWMVAREVKTLIVYVSTEYDRLSNNQMYYYGHDLK